MQMVRLHFGQNADMQIETLSAYAYVFFEFEFLCGIRCGWSGCSVKYCKEGERPFDERVGPVFALKI